MRSPIFIFCFLALLQEICDTSAKVKRRWHPRRAGFAANQNRRVWVYDDLSNSQSVQNVLHMSQSDTEQAQCGYSACDLGKPGMLNIHLVPHTHDDVGWLKTVDQYYYGAHNEIQHAGVQYILDTVIDQLLKDPRKRMIYVEIAFFYRWWSEQHDSLRHVVKGLVNQGRLEFILGGWCMNDEASTHYNAIIDQHTVGFRFLKRNFGDCSIPKIGWQIDPFGHSREQASLFAQFGFDGLFFGRLDYQDKEKRLKDKTMEQMWLASNNLGDSSALFTGVNYNGYGPPDGFCFDSGCNDPPIMDNPDMENYNVDQRVKDFIKVAKEQAAHYTTNHIMMTMGSDFQFENAWENYKNLDKLIKFVNEAQSNGSKVNLLYSTPSCYLYAVHQTNQTYTTKSDDFFPYASRSHTFWTGYFTSRPALKGYVRTTNNFLQVCKQLDVLSNLGPAYNSAIKLDILRRAMGIAQHHDAVSGTEKQPVADDYALRLAKGVDACQDVINDGLSKLVPAPGSHVSVQQSFCHLINVSFCPLSEQSNQFAVLLYNPVGRPVVYWAQIPVNGKAYKVIDKNLTHVQSQLMPLSPQTVQIPDHNGSHATANLVFRTLLPPLGYSTYMVTRLSNDAVYHTLEVSKFSKPVRRSKREQNRPRPAKYLNNKLMKDTVIRNEHLQMTFSQSSGLLTSVTVLNSTISVPVSQNILYYKSFVGNNSEPEYQSSGAYIFRPNGSSPIPVAKDQVKLEMFQGELVQEVRQTFSDWASQTVRLYKGAKYAEIEWTIGPIPIGDGIGKEVISEFTSDFETNATFYTDSNGREILKRVIDYRPTWKLNQTEVVAGNYYPVNSRIFIRDEKKGIQLTVLTDRSQGGASLHDGQLELMIHRRTLVDDAFGVGEPLNETGITGNGLVIRGKHYLLLSSISEAAALHRDLAEQLFMAPVVSFAAINEKPEKYKAKHNLEWSGLNKPLPANVHLLTLEEWEANSFLLRLEHFYEKDEDPILSQPAVVHLRGLFSSLNITSVVELTLGANQKLSEAHRLQWNIKGHGATSGDMASFVIPVDPTALIVTLKPMQIRTFQVFFVVDEFTK